MAEKHPKTPDFTGFSGVFVVETTGIEPVTPCMSSKYSNQLSYASIVLRLYIIAQIDCVVNRIS